MLRKAITSALALPFSVAFAAGNGPDFGLRVQRRLGNGSLNYFGVAALLAKSAVDPNGEDMPSGDPRQTASTLVTLTDDLSVRYLTRSAAGSTDSMACWPSDGAPPHIILSSSKLGPRRPGTHRNAIPGHLCPTHRRHAPERATLRELEGYCAIWTSTCRSTSRHSSRPHRPRCPQWPTAPRRLSLPGRDKSRSRRWQAPRCCRPARK